MMTNDDGLQKDRPLKNPRHEAFCLAYVGEHRRNGAASYLAAGYSCKSREVARRMASRLLERQDVAGRVGFLEDDLAGRERLRALDAIRHLQAVATVTLADFYKDGRIDPDKLNDPWLMQAVAEVMPIYDRAGNVLDYKVKMKDSMRALELLGLTEQTEKQGADQQILVIKV